MKKLVPAAEQHFLQHFHSRLVVLPVEKRIRVANSVRCTRVVRATRTHCVHSNQPILVRNVPSKFVHLKLFLVAKHSLQLVFAIAEFDYR